MTGLSTLQTCFGRSEIHPRRAGSQSVSHSDPQVTWDKGAAEGMGKGYDDNMISFPTSQCTHKIASLGPVLDMLAA